MIRKRHGRGKTDNVVMRKILVILGILLLIGSLTTGCDDSVLEGLADDDSFINPGDTVCESHGERRERCRSELK